MDHFDGLCLKEHRKGNWRPQNQMGRKNLPGLRLDDLMVPGLDDLSILDESVSKMNEFLEVLQVQSARTGLKINVKKTKSIRLGISEDENVTLGNKKIDQVGSFTYLSIIISKDIGSSECIKSRMAKAQGVFSQLNIVWKPKSTNQDQNIGSYSDDSVQIWL